MRQVEAHEYVCGDCGGVTTFRHNLIPFRRWLLTCWRCHRYRRHYLIVRYPGPRLVR